MDRNPQDIFDDPSYECDEPIEPDEPCDQLSDLDQDNPVDCSRECWEDLYAENPDLLDYDTSMDY